MDKREGAMRFPLVTFLLKNDTVIVYTFCIIIDMSNKESRITSTRPWNIQMLPFFSPFLDYFREYLLALILTQQWRRSG